MYIYIIWNIFATYEYMCKTYDIFIYKFGIFTYIYINVVYLHIYMYVYIYINVDVYIQVYIYIPGYLCLSTNQSICLSTCVFTPICLSIYIHLSLYLCFIPYRCMHLSIHVYRVALISRLLNIIGFFCKRAL